jgi:hypothetical protein
MIASLCTSAAMYVVSVEVQKTDSVRVTRLVVVFVPLATVTVRGLEGWRAQPRRFDEKDVKKEDPLPLPLPERSVEQLS